MVGNRVGHRITPEDQIERDRKMCTLFSQGVPARALSTRFGLSVPRVLQIVKESRGKND